MEAYICNTLHLPQLAMLTFDTQRHKAIEVISFYATQHKLQLIWAKLQAKTTKNPHIDEWSAQTRAHFFLQQNYQKNTK